MPSNWAHLGGGDYLNLDTAIRVTFRVNEGEPLEATVTTTGMDGHRFEEGGPVYPEPFTLTFTGTQAEALKAALWRRTKGA